jgi:hypothetical protein
MCCSTILHKITTLFLFRSTKKKRPKNATLIPLYINSLLKKYGSYYSCSSGGTSHTNLLIVKGYLKTLPWINSAPLPADLSTDITTQVEPRFISIKYKFWIKNTSTYQLQKPVTKMRSPLEITFFSYLTCLILYGSR